MAVTVVTMGVHYRWEFPEALSVQLRLAHDLREDLVAAQIAAEAKVSAVWSQYQQIAELEAAVAGAQTEVDEAMAVVAEIRAQSRKRVGGAPAEQVKQARAQLKELRARRRAEIGKARVVADPQIREIYAAMYATQKQLYRLYCTDGNLYWSTFNSVVADHKTAVNRVKKARQQGRHAQLRPHHFDGTGTITVQLVRTADQPARTPQMLANPDSRFRNILVVPWTEPQVWAQLSRGEQRRAGRVTVRMRCGSLNGVPQWIEIPVQQHRMLPADADITMARLTVTRVSDRFTAQLSLVAKLDDPSPRQSGPDVAVRLGWREDPADPEAIVVANWRSSTTLEVPETVRELLTVNDGATTGTIRLPGSVASQVAYANRLASQRAHELAAIREQLVAWLTEHGPLPHPAPGSDELTATEVARWMSAARFATLESRWREQPPAGAAAIVEALSQWRRRDVPMWRRQAHSRLKALRRRRDFYRQVAAVVSATAGRVVVDDTSLSQIAAIAALPDGELSREVRQRIAHRRTVAAPGSLRELLIAAATRDGVPVTTVPSAGLITTHPACGHTSTVREVDGDQVVCHGCGQRFDPYQAATQNMLDRAASSKHP
ncbi:hypothetical protein AB4Z55_26240 [Gordonia sp. ABKF26]|uniref:hypothetical protein n=1 Tax=Gordonia sp. ABKF26 TaxID=3238687 RepID=UPI0034E579D1